ncbi:phosphoribosylanthranilate isomerase [bacterium D16-51]|nr:phosphoribosylanthranilate isomerase [bacterium D16-59]RKI59382.1 phosphoribosylanthranilate isomerase [bacterium D16-51]
MKIKICGLTRVEEAAYLNQCQVDFAGFVLFYPKSKRNITMEQAEKIAQALDFAVKRVAVVVSPSLQQIRQIEASAARFDYIQVHGALSGELLEQFRLPVLRAFNVTDMGNYPFYHASDKVAGYVFDAAEPGSGKTFDWSLVKQVPRDEKLFLLAGGLNPGNVREAAGVLCPDGVDVSSGVEYDDKPGKDLEKVKSFVQNAGEMK